MCFCITVFKKLRIFTEIQEYLALKQAFSMLKQDMKKENITFDEGKYHAIKSDP